MESRRRVTRARTAAALLGVLVALAVPTGAAAATECEGDSCQVPPAEPVDQTPGTAVVEGAQNPPVHLPGQGGKGGKNGGHHRHHHHKHHRGGGS